MRFAAIADIHGNCCALDAVLADIESEQITEVVNLGDHFSGPLEAGRTAARLMEHDFPSIRGNHDRSLIDLKPDAMGASDNVAYNQLTKTHLAWLSSLPATLTYADDVFLCHGTPSCDNTYWLERVRPDATIEATPVEDIEAEAKGIDCSLILCGHTHIPRIVRLRDGRLVVNPGSVGCPGYDNDTPVFHIMQTGTPHACYAILEKRSGDWTVTFRLVPYDHMSMSALAAERNRPEWASALATGWVHDTAS